jgi:hypothetical protein
MKWCFGWHRAAKWGRVVLNALKRIVMFCLDLITKTLFNEIALLKVAPIIHLGKHADWMD